MLGRSRDGISRDQGVDLVLGAVQLPNYAVRDGISRDHLSMRAMGFLAAGIESGAVLDDQWRLGLLIVSGFPAACLCARWAFSRQG